MNLLLLILTLIVLPTAEEPDIRAVLKDAKSKKYDVRLAAYDQLIEMGPAAAVALESVLRHAEDRARRDFLSYAKGSGAKAFRRKLKGDIKEAQKEALAIIRDRNIYPDDAHGAVGQPKVDSKVALLREMWMRPGRLFIERVPEINNTLYYIKEAAQYLKRAGLRPNWYDEDLKGAYVELDEVFEPLSIMYSPAERKKIEELRGYNATCPSTATDEERRFVRILNDYRLMLGLKALEMDDRLVVASRKHSQEMMDMNYFAHESPVAENRTPGLRARKEGYGGGVLENCAISAGAYGAFDGWYTSSGHHRGLIASSVTQLGIGHSVSAGGGEGRQWTMMAGSSGSLRGKKAKESPRLTFLTRRQKLKSDDAETRFALAKFCLKNEMRDEAQELLKEVIALDAEHRHAHKLVGHVRYNGAWVTPEERLLKEVANRGEEEVIQEVALRLKDDEPSVRLAAVRVIETIGDRRGTPVLIQALKDNASEVRDAACGVLASFSAYEAVPSLKGMLNDRSFYVAHSAAAALWRLGDPSGRATLFKGLRSGNLNPRIDAHRKTRAILGQDFGYAWDLPAEKRARVVNDWEAWALEETPPSPPGQSGSG